jgi:hypothetical protein
MKTMFDCSCDECAKDRFPADWTPSERFEDVLNQVRYYVDAYLPALTWLAGWTVRVEPIRDDPSGNPEWSMRINSAAYIRTAIIEVRESVLDHDRFLGEEHTIKLMVLHELCHLLIEPMRYVFNNWASDQEGMPAQAAYSFQDAEEVAVWHLARFLQSMALVDTPEEQAECEDVAGRIRSLHDMVQTASDKETVKVSKALLAELADLTADW